MRQLWVCRVLTGLCCLVTLNGCKHAKVPGKTAIASLNLVRGELTLCGSGQLGRVGLSPDCVGESLETFELAVSLLHSFEYTEAEKAFSAVIDANPDCAMAYWGVVWKTTSKGRRGRIVYKSRLLHINTYI